MAVTSSPKGEGGAFRWWGFVGHALMVSALSAAFAWVTSSAEEPNIGAGFLMIPLLLLGLPWSVLPFLPSGTGFLVSDAAVIGLAMVNVGLHLALMLCWRRPPAPWSTRGERRVLATTGALIAASVVVVVAVGVMAASGRARQADAIAAILPVPPWTKSVAPRAACMFCKPFSARVDLSGSRATTPEPELLAGIDARLGQAGYAPDEPWDCSDIPDDQGRFDDPGQIPPPRLLRSCSRGYTADDVSAFAVVEYVEGRSATAWIDVHRL